MIHEKKDEWVFCYWDDCTFINQLNKEKYGKPKDCTSREENPDSGEKTGGVLSGDQDNDPGDS